MKFKTLFLLFSLLFAQSFQACAMELTSQENGDVIDQAKQDTLIEKINATFPDEIRQHIFNFSGQTYLYNELLAKINNAQSHVELMQVQKEIIATALYCKRKAPQFNIKGLIQQLETKKIGNLKRIQALHDDFDAFLKPEDKRPINIANAIDKKIVALKNDILWKTINSFNIYDKDSAVTFRALLLLNELCKTVDCHNSYNRKGQSPATRMACFYYDEGFKCLRILTDHDVDITKPDRNGNTVFDAINEVYDPNSALSRIIALPIDYFCERMPKRKFVKEITSTIKD